MTSLKYEGLLSKGWERIGCLIIPEGLPNYQVQSPIDYVEPLSAASESNTVLGETDENTNLEEEEYDEEHPVDERSIAMDREGDRDFTVELVAMKIKVLYHNGWVVGDL